MYNLAFRLIIPSMASLTEEQIKEIAEMLDCGFRSYWHKHTGELLFILNNEDYTDFDEDLKDEDLEKLNNNPDDYFEIDKPDSNDSFKIMENFAYQLEGNDELKSELFKALNKRKPFREFKWVIDNSGDYRQQWFDFKSAELKQWVIDNFKAVTNDNTEEEIE